MRISQNLLEPRRGRVALRATCRPRRPVKSALSAWASLFLIGSILGIALPAAGAEWTPEKADRTIQFSRYDWRVKSSPQSSVGPGPNLFASDNVRIQSGKLYLTVDRSDGEWRSAEVVLTRSLGYGTYSFVVESDVANLDPNIVLGMFTWSDDPTAAHREIDIEVSRWGSATNSNAQCAMQPYAMPNHLARFELPRGSAPTRFSFSWAPNGVRCSVQRMHGEPSATRRPPVFKWRFTTGPPPSGDESARINLWLLGGQPPTDGEPRTVIISKFSFNPSRGH